MGVPVRMRRRSLVDDLPDLSMPEFPRIPEDTVDVLANYLLSRKTQEKAVTKTPAVVVEPAVPQQPIVTEIPTEVEDVDSKSAWVNV